MTTNTTAILDCPMDPATNDAEASTVREYLTKLLATLWEEEEGFTGKRPFGNSGWQYDVYGALVKAGLIEGTFDDDGDLVTVEDDKADTMILEAIGALR